jgi:F0F1-type ATP synthase membrane subunit b/b'
MKKKAKEEQEELAFDLKMLEQLLEESRNEAMEQLQRKVCGIFNSLSQA